MGTTEDTGGLSTATLDSLLGFVKDSEVLAAARAELAALRATVERHHKRADMLQGALEDAARHIGPPEDYSRSSDDGMWDLASRIAWVLQTFGGAEIADGPGAAGARDERTERASEQIAAGWRVIHDALDWAALRHEPHPDPAKRDHYAHNPANRHLWDAKAQIEAGLDALRAGGAGETEG